MSQVIAKGPLFDGRAARQVVKLNAELIEETSQEAFEEVGAALDVMLKNPTGFYESRITQDRSRESAVVHDSGVIYGPWLAGVSSLNQKSRFKGYAHWRRATQRTQSKVPQIAARVLPKHVARMNR